MLVSILQRMPCAPWSGSRILTAIRSPVGVRGFVQRNYEPDAYYRPTREVDEPWIRLLDSLDSVELASYGFCFDLKLAHGHYRVLAFLFVVTAPTQARRMYGNRSC